MSTSFQIRTLAPPVTMPAIAPARVVRFQKSEKSMIGPKVAPKPAQANETRLNITLFSSHATITPTIEIATRTLSPEVIFCDEIGSADEARAILSAQNSGVPLIATAHAENREMLLRRPNIRTLYDNGIFRYYIGLSRASDTKNFIFDVFDACEEVMTV